MTNGDRVIAISDFIASHVNKVFPGCANKVRIINRGIDTDYFDLKTVSKVRKEKLLSSLSIYENKHIILLPGRLSEWKGQMIAIKAAEILKNEYSHLNFVMLFVGSSQDRNSFLKKIEKTIVNLKLDSQILLTGNKQDMPAVYSIADVVISTSIEPEAFGRVSAEASSMTKPIIATNIGGSKAIIDDKKTGWLIEKNNPKLLAKTIMEIIDKPQHEKDKIGYMARKRILENFKLSVMLNKTIKVYEEVLK